MYQTNISGFFLILYWIISFLLFLPLPLYWYVCVSIELSSFLFKFLVELNSKLHKKETKCSQALIYIEFIASGLKRFCCMQTSIKRENKWRNHILFENNKRTINFMILSVINHFYARSSILNVCIIYRL